MKPPVTPIAEAPLVIVEPAKTPADAPVNEYKAEPVKDTDAPQDERPFLQKHSASTVTAALGVVALGVGVGFGASSASATAELRNDVHPREYADGLVKKANESALGANVAYGVAGAALITAVVVLFFVEPPEGAK